MKSKADRDRLRVAAMTEAIEQMRQDLGGSKEDFLNPGLVQRAVLLSLIHLTESAERTSGRLKALNPTFPWARLSRMRNRGLVHDYEQVDLEDLWRFLRDDLTTIRRRLDRMRFPAEDG